MAPLKFCANISWLFAELPDFTQRIYAAASCGFQAVEAAWLYDCELQELQRARKATGVEVILINTPPGDVKSGDLGLGAVPGREKDFREGLDLAVRYAKALECKRIHLMAGRIPVDVNRSQVAKEMETVFVHNLTYAADILSKEGIMGTIEPINTRITDPSCCNTGEGWKAKYQATNGHLSLANNGWKPHTQHFKVFAHNRTCSDCPGPR
ncbi:putative hydroxypyruvate isomerase isoform X1 [Xyrichtys novacula]|uniref:Hydroxypyruvate isomerase isoform X1 n=1 Tax=Xyrichtys novacula TaxID=13765 RepID=A0AAV1FWT8_XYRNO|nr:putative hydroxypyruvate isomerase isoform X1 [Xyrichtys novacula]